MNFKYTKSKKRISLYKTIYVPFKVLEKIGNIAEKKECSVNTVIREILIEYLERKKL